MTQNLNVLRIARQYSNLSQKTVARLFIIAGVLIISAALALRIPSGWFALILLGVAPTLVGILFLLRWPPLGILLLVASGLVLPFSIATGTGTSLNSIVILTPTLSGLWILDMVIRGKVIRLHYHRTVFLSLGLGMVSLLAFIVGQLPWFTTTGAGLASQVGGLFVFMLSVAAFLLAVHQFDECWLQRLAYLFLAIGAFYLVGRLAPSIGRFYLGLFDTGATGSVFWTWIVALPAGLAMFHRSLSSRWRLSFFVLAGSGLYISITQSPTWFSGWGTALIALLIILWLRFPRWGWIIIFGAIVILIFRWNDLFIIATDEQSWWARRQAWQIVLDTVRVNPILGLGPSNYYFYVQQADIAGWGGSWNVRFASHNNYVDLIAQTGLLGLALFIGFAFAIGHVGWDLYRRLPDGFARAYAAACLGGLIATLASGMLGDWFLPFVYNIGLAGMRSSILFWIFLGGLLALYMRHKQQGLV